MKIKIHSISQVQHNRRVHDLVVGSYERIHTEIYNATEQARLAIALAEATSFILSPTALPLAVDFGAGTGNLTKHLLRQGLRVLAMDVSPKCLSDVQQALGETGRLSTAELNGIDLSNLEDNSVDIVATYSVLHHIPDYLRIVREFVRVVKSGGVIYIDHESAPCFWLEDSSDYKAYRNELWHTCGQPLVRRVGRKLRKLLSSSAWKRLVDRRLYALGDEGDIHVRKDDHIEWDRIEKVLAERCILLRREDYLVCREADPSPPVYNKYAGKCVDMRVVVCRKN